MIRVPTGFAGERVSAAASGAELGARYRACCGVAAGGATKRFAPPVSPCKQTGLTRRFRPDPSSGMAAIGTGAPGLPSDVGRCTPRAEGVWRTFRVPGQLLSDLALYAHRLLDRGFGNRAFAYLMPLHALFNFRVLYNEGAHGVRP